MKQVDQWNNDVFTFQILFIRTSTLYVRWFTSWESTYDDSAARFLEETEDRTGLNISVIIGQLVQDFTRFCLSA